MGLVAALVSAVSIPASLFGGRLADRMGRRTTVVLAYVAWWVWVTAVSLSTGLSAFAFLAVFSGFIEGGLFPSVDAWSADVCPSQFRGTYTGVLRFVGFIAAVPGPLIGAWLWSARGPAAPLQMAGAIALAAGLLLYRFGPKASRAAASLGAQSSPG